MPIFEYSCRGCGHEFETLVMPSGPAPACPKCEGQDLEKLVTLPSLKSETTHALAMRAAKKRDSKQAAENARIDAEYRAHHDD